MWRAGHCEERNSTMEVSQLAFSILLAPRALQGAWCAELQMVVLFMWSVSSDLSPKRRAVGLEVGSRVVLFSDSCTRDDNGDSLPGGLSWKTIALCVTGLREFCLCFQLCLWRKHLNTLHLRICSFYRLTRAYPLSKRCDKRTRIAKRWRHSVEEKREAYRRGSIACVRCNFKMYHRTWLHRYANLVFFSVWNAP